MLLYWALKEREVANRIFSFYSLAIQTKEDLKDNLLGELKYKSGEIMNKIKYALIGYGRISHKQLMHLLQIKMR